jgi:LysR family transcriptional regulator, nitrogen assimilation regulatory protein
MELWHLRYFVLVAELESIAQASAHLNIAAPAVSRAIKSLEDELQARLFDRNGRGMHLTLSGRALLPRATQLLRDAEITKQEVSATGRDLAGEVTIGATPSIIAVAGPSLVRRCRERFPHIRLRVIEGYSGYLQDWVRTGAINIALVNGQRQTGTRLSFELLAVERLFAVAAPGAFGGYQSGIPLDLLLKEPLLLPSLLNPVRSIIDTAAAGLGLPIKTMLEVDSVGLLKDFVYEGLAPGILPFGAVKKEAEAGELFAAPIIGPEIHSEIRLVYLSELPPSPVAAAVIAILKEILGEVRAADSRGVFVD